MNQKHPTKWVLGAVFGMMLLLALAVALTGCGAGEPGATGPAGPAGAAGAVGPAGPAGAAADAGECADCHNDSMVLKTKQVQASASLHTGGMTFERGGSADCAACHTSQGFTARNGQSDLVTLEAGITSPGPINCRTCHNIHVTGTDADWSLVYTAPVKLAINGDTIDLGKGNLCASCHQPRAVDVPTTGDFEVTSTRFGPHHGPQSTVLTGKATYMEYKGSSVHAMVPDGCVTCHMADAFGKQSGDHTWKMGYEYHEATVPNVAGCITCHPELADDPTFDRGGLVTEVEELLAEAKTALVAAGILADSGSTVPGTYSAELAGACFDYKTIVEDRSNGVHNPGFTKALLKNAIAIANAQ